MNLSDLTNPNLLELNSNLTNKDDVIKALAKMLFDDGKLQSEQAFLDAVYAREKLSETGMEAGLAIPHGKSTTVKEACFAVMTTKAPVEDWESLDPDNEVKYIFLLAIPEAEAGSTHVELLAELMQRMSDDEYTKRLFTSNTKEDFFHNLDQDIEENINNDIVYTKLIVAVTACPAGIAHTYMAAEALVKAGNELGAKVYVEKQGANGIEDRHTAEHLKNADAAIFAVGVSVKNEERFAHLPITRVEVAAPIKNGKAVIEQALAKAENFKKGEYVDTGEQDAEENIGITIKKSVLTGISHMIPLIVAGGMIGAFAVLIANTFGLTDLYNEPGSWLNLLRQLAGGLLGTLLVPVMAAYMAYSIADKPALAPGFAAGFAANVIGGGFLAGMLGGIIAGYLVRKVRKTIPAKGSFAGFISFFIYPVLNTLLVGIIMFFIIGEPVAWLNRTMIDFLGGLSGANAMLLGAILGIMVSFDLGGPVNKAAYTFCVAALGDGIFLPYAIFASVKMVSGFAVTMATITHKDIFSQEEKEAGKSTWMLALGGITEGAIPFMMVDPIRAIVALCTGSAITGAIIGWANIGLNVPGAGIISLFLLTESAPVTNPFMAAAIWFFAAVLGAIISTIMLVALRRAKLNNAK